jgi:hypothetical protein
MKNLKQHFMYVFVFSFLLSSCQKEDNIIKSSDNKMFSSNREWRDCLTNVRIGCDHILKFSDMTHFQAVYNCLEQAYETWNDNFENQYSYITDDDDYGDLADSLGFDEEQPLKDFEAYLHFYSYRRKMEILENQWIANGLDPASDPEIFDILEDPVLMTLFSHDGAVIINDTIYWIDKWGNMYQINNGDCELLVKLQGDSTLLSSDPNISLFSHSSGYDNCKYDKDKAGENPYVTGSKKYFWKTSFRYHPWGTSIKGKMRHYLKKSGSWRKRPAKLTVNPYGIHYDYQCDQSANYNDSKQKRKRKLRNGIMFWGEKHHFKSGDPKCYFKAEHKSDSGSNTAVLTF